MMALVEVDFLPTPTMSRGMAVHNSDSKYAEVAMLKTILHREVFYGDGMVGRKQFLTDDVPEFGRSRHEE